MMKKFKDMEDLAEVAKAVERGIKKEKKSADKSRKKRSLDTLGKSTSQFKKPKVSGTLQ